MLEPFWSQMALLKDIAAEVGISVAAASLALRGDRRISEKTKQRVWDAQRKLGSSPESRGAKRMKRNGIRKVSKIAFILIDRTIEHSGYFSHLQGMANVGKEKHIEVVYFSLTRDEVLGRKLPLTLQNGEIDGVVVSGCYDLELHAVFEELQLKLVVLGNYHLPGKMVATIEIDAAQGMADMLALLVERGHSRIAVVHGEATLDIERAMRARYIIEAERLGLELDDILTRSAVDDSEASVAIRSLLSLPVRPTAILFTRRARVELLYSIANEFKLNIPKDISVAALGSFSPNEEERSRLTVIGLDGTRFGEAALDKLLRVINQGEFAHTREILPMMLNEGSSVATVSPNPKSK